MTKAAIAVLNAGSSSIKFALYADAPDLPVLFRGQMEQIGIAPHLSAKDSAGNPVAEASWPAKGFDHRSATQVVLETARDLLAGAQVRGVGHRVVHGGTDFAEPVRIDADVLAALRKLEPLAPLHQPHNLAPIAAIAEAAPHIAQVACFDTAFHRRQPDLAQMFAIPRRLTEAGVRRYGFHGLSYEYVAQRLAEVAPDLHSGRVIVCHLGNGASLCALRGGASVATTMGFTAVDGLMMGTRCGALDPGVLIYLMDEEGLDARGIENLVYRQSGLLGVSGISSDMRALRASEDPAAGEAIALFVYRIVREIGSLAAALGGLDALVFTGGIGEHDTLTRQEIAKGCAWLGLTLDAARNEEGEGRISAGESRLAAWVVPTDEEKMIARHTTALLALGNPAAPQPIAV
ncbi:MAG: acetate/propionate family kinase [Alphaproteobacteria bacterium]|nr:MAG: acetate/propionate family kinase [Alphaproteobacteria bacterium]